MALSLMNGIVSLYQKNDFLPKELRRVSQLLAMTQILIVASTTRTAAGASLEMLIEKLQKKKKEAD